MWLPDEQYEFIKDSREKKITARSASKQRTHAGKGGSVKFPSDYLTRKELKAMNGPVTEYNLSKPMSWDKFKSIPRDAQIEYIKGIRERFDGCTDTAIGEMFGVSSRTVSLYVKDLGLALGRGAGGSRKWDKDTFHRWAFPTQYLNEGKEEKSEDTNEETPVENTPETSVEPVGEDITIAIEPSVEIDIPKEKVKRESQEMFDKVRDEGKICAVPNSGSMTFECPADLALNTIAQLLGNSHVKLSIQWEVIEEVKY